MREATIQAIGTALPRYRGRQSDAAEFFKKVAEAAVAGEAAPGNGGGGARRGDARAAHAAIDRIYRRSAIESRQSVLEDYLREPADFSFFPRNWALHPSPSTGARMELYKSEAPPLARAAAERCLSRAPHVDRRAITHLIVVTCTGFFAPGLDIVLARELGLRPDVQRQIIGFMGCYGAFNGLRAARAVCRSEPDAVALVVCVELCTIHFQQELTMDNFVANCLFSDGAAAALVTSGERGPGVLELVDSYTLVEDDSLDQMTWTVTDTGFRMTLTAEVPETLRARAGPFVETLLARNGCTLRDVGFWAVHPGGRRIVEAVQERLDLPDDAVAPSYGVLADHGNMSSPTILFVLDRCLERRPPPGAIGVAMAFGPGLTLESFLVRVPME
jgi:predicted naringenin-chalcone synthase